MGFVGWLCQSLWGGKVRSEFLQPAGRKLSARRLKPVTAGYITSMSDHQAWIYVDFLLSLSFYIIRKALRVGITSEPILPRLGFMVHVPDQASALPLCV